MRTGPFEIAPTTPEIRANFSAVRPERPDADVIVFLEDTVEIQQQAQQLKLAALGRLSASIAHEIRNPLGAISHAGQLLSESRNLDKGDTRLTDIINMQSRRMNGVIENVLELSRRKPPSPIRLNLKNWLTDFVTEFRQSMPDAGRHTYQRGTDCDRGARRPGTARSGADESRGERLALQQGKDRPRNAVDRRRHRPIDRPAVSERVDDGPGVPEDRVDNLFEPFFTTERTGTGLGLYITREMCEANQARVTYTRDQRGGSCFRITFAHPDRITA